MIIGGVAASLQGHPRLTADVDATVLLDESSMDRFLQQASQHGLVSRIKNPLAFARQSAMLLLKHEQTGVAVDIAQSRLLFETEALHRAKQIKVKNMSVPVATSEDLIIMKAIAHRPQDLQDIRAIITANPQLDVRFISTHVRDFAKALEMPELWTNIAGLFK